MRLISVRNLDVCYGSHVALRNVDIDIYSDDFLGIIGPNGGGKTSLVKALMGVVSYGGVIEYDRSLLDGRSRKIGYLPQQNDFDKSFPISVREVVLSGLQSSKGLFGRYGKEDKRRAAELIEMVGIGDIAAKPVGELSGGQLQRTLLCRALISEPRVLILDEPANFVDNKFEKELYEILHRLNERMAILMVSHDLGTITSVVKNIVCVNREVHRHDSNEITAEQLANYDCPIQLITHGEVPHTVLEHHH